MLLCMTNVCYDTYYQADSIPFGCARLEKLDAPKLLIKKLKLTQY